MARIDVPGGMRAARGRIGGVLLLAAAMVALAGHSAARQAAKRPNIVVIMADDMGFSDIGCYGGEIRTPNLDRLAAGGLRFTQFYNTARCCPTRAALLTGLYSHQAGVGHMIEDRGHPGYTGYLNNRCVTIAEALRPAGYRTFQVGKWHVGEDRPHWPVDRGFDHSFSLISGGSSYFQLDNGRRMAIDDRPYAPPAQGFYMTDAFSDRAFAFVDEFGRKPEPFFLYLAYTSPHWPLHAPPEVIARYRGSYMGGWDALRIARHERMIRMGIVSAAWPLTPRDPAAPAWNDAKDHDLLDLKMAVYAAQIERMDTGIGRLLQKLRDLEIEANTLVLFLSDNGGCAEEVNRGEKGAPPGQHGSFMSYGLPWANASNTPFRLFKHWVHEGGIATPLIARWPARQTATGLTSQPGHVIDLMATALDAAGAAYLLKHDGNDVLPLEGRSLLPILEGKQRAGHEALFWEHEGNRAVRQGKWKLVARHRGPWELYDLQADRTEMRNLAADEPERVKAMTGLYEAWAKRCGVLPWPPPPKA